MSLKDNKEFINLKSEDRKGFYDLEVRVENDVTYVKTDTGFALGLTISEIEALYHFSQVLKTN